MKELFSDEGILDFFFLNVNIDMKKKREDD